MRFLSLLVFCVFMYGCASQPSTPKEEEEQEQRMREFLIESSPRNMNKAPKVVPEFTRTFNTGKKQPPKAEPSTNKGDDVKQPMETW